MSEIRAARPPENFTVRRTWVLDSTEGLGQLRGSLFEELTGDAYVKSSALDAIPEKMVLVVSELATNALRHGKPPTIVTLMENTEEHLLDVADHDVSTEPAVAQGRELGAGGFGLVLAQRLAFDVGWYVSDRTKHIWARFPFTEATAPA
ncbi:ATP-binding protein [Sanguibacter sp. 25GB23B1]|uniref:ATP-binding protein n=1 Tax=unclassified Sanguibacter TaxID=2645534 RepID=UPI0032AFF137